MSYVKFIKLNIQKCNRIGNNLMSANIPEYRLFIEKDFQTKKNDTMDGGM